MEGQTVRERLSTVEKAINGNGKDGLKTEIALIKQEQENMNKDLEKIATSMSALAQSQTKQDVIDKHKEENKGRRYSAIKYVGTIFTIVLGALGAFYLILDHIG